jgi:hypothetical protein
MIEQTVRPKKSVLRECIDVSVGSRELVTKIKDFKKVSYQEAEDIMYRYDMIPEVIRTNDLKKRIYFLENYIQRI